MHLNMSGSILTPSGIHNNDSVSSFCLRGVVSAINFSLVLFFFVDGQATWCVSSLSFSSSIYVFSWFGMYSTYTCSSNYFAFFSVRDYVYSAYFLGSSVSIRSLSSSFKCCVSPIPVCRRVFLYVGVLQFASWVDVHFLYFQVLFFYNHWTNRFDH
jgi:hypothetical protein